MDEVDSELLIKDLKVELNNLLNGLFNIEEVNPDYILVTKGRILAIESYLKNIRKDKIDLELDITRNQIK